MDLFVSTESAFGPSSIRRLNVWYSCNNGNWSDPNTWYSNALDKKNVTSPRVGDVVYINHSVNLDVTASVSNIYISGKLSSNVNGLTLNVTGDLQASGTVDFTSNTTTVNLFGYNNFITTFVPGNSTMIYTRAGDQNIMPITYKNMSVFGIGIKRLTANTTLNGDLNINAFRVDNAFLECSTFNLTVTGFTNIQAANSIAGGNLGKSGAGTIIFGNQVGFNSNLNISSSVTNVEFRTGGTIEGFGGNCAFNCPVTFTTNSQSILTTNSSPCQFNNTVTITGAITVTNTGNGTYFNGVLNGTVSGSTYNNNGATYLGISTLPMATGVFNYNNATTSLIGYMFNGNFTLPYTAYAFLTLQGTGTKTLSGNTTIAKDFNLSNFTLSDTILDCSTFNLTVTGSTTVGDSNAGILSSHSGSALLFIGGVNFNSGGFVFGSGVTLEFRNGLTFNTFGHSINIDAAINFTTNSQSYTTTSIITYTGTVTIASGITFTANFGVNASQCNIFTGVINGASTTSILNTNAGFINYQNATAPMVTGKLYANQATNTWIYGLGGNQDIQTPGDPTPGYKNLILQGSGAKRLLGNVSVKGTYTLTSPATLNSNGFALTNP